MSLCSFLLHICQCAIYLLPLFWNRDFGGLSAGAMEGFFANLHFDSRNSAFQRPCNPAHHPTFGTQKNRKIEKKKKTRAKEALSFAVSFLGLERHFLPRHPSHVKMLALRFTLRCPAEVASQRYGSIWLSVRMMITAKLILLHWTIQGCALHPHGFLEMRHF